VAPTRPETSADQEIRRHGVLDGPPGRELQALVELAALVAGVPRAAINIITSDQQHQVATTGVQPSVCTRGDSMCAAVLGEEQVVAVPDASVDARFQANPFVTGELGTVRFYASAGLVTRAGVPLGRLCVFDDVPRELDEIKRRALQVVAERVVDVLELRLRSDELHRSNELLAKFAGQISHDLRTPLTAMLLNTELVQQDPAVASDPELVQLLSTVMAAGMRMSRLIDDVLDFARVGGELRRHAVDLDDLLGEVLADLGPTLDDAEARVDVEGRLGSVVGDRQQLYSVLLNLLTNAVKFSRPGTPPRVRVTGERTDAGLCVRVKDNGIGIPAEQQEHVFDLFTRADRRVAGSGIGLATVRAAVEAHGGEVGVRSTPGEGTTFWFTLPLDRQDA
jgi:signal transduction histidine kinase